MTRGVSDWGRAALGAAAVVLTSAAAAPAALSVRYPANGPGLSIVSEPALAFHCAPSGRTVICTAAVPRGTALRLRARTRPPAGSASTSAMSLPIDGKAWRGACAGTPADLCRLRVTRATTVRIDTRIL